MVNYLLGLLTAFVFGVASVWLGFNHQVRHFLFICVNVIRYPWIVIASLFYPFSPDVLAHRKRIDKSGRYHEFGHFGYCYDPKAPWHSRFYLYRIKKPVTQ